MNVRTRSQDKKKEKDEKKSDVSGRVITTPLKGKKGAAGKPPEKPIEKKDMVVVSDSESEAQQSEDSNPPLYDNPIVAEMLDPGMDIDDKPDPENRGKNTKNKLAKDMLRMGSDKYADAVTARKAYLDKINKIKSKKQFKDIPDDDRPPVYANETDGVLYTKLPARNENSLKKKDPGAMDIDDDPFNDRRYYPIGKTEYKDLDKKYWRPNYRGYDKYISREENLDEREKPFLDTLLKSDNTQLILKSLSTLHSRYVNSNENKMNSISENFLSLSMDLGCSFGDYDFFKNIIKKQFVDIKLNNGLNAYLTQFSQIKDSNNILQHGNTDQDILYSIFGNTTSDANSIPKNFVHFFLMMPTLIVKKDGKLNYMAVIADIGLINVFLSKSNSIGEFCSMILNLKFAFSSEHIPEHNSKSLITVTEESKLSIGSDRHSVLPFGILLADVNSSVASPGYSFKNKRTIRFCGLHLDNIQLQCFNEIEMLDCIIPTCYFNHRAVFFYFDSTENKGKFLEEKITSPVDIFNKEWNTNFKKEADQYEVISYPILHTPLFYIYYLMVDAPVCFFNSKIPIFKHYEGGSKIDLLPLRLNSIDDVYMYLQYILGSGELLKNTKANMASIHEAFIWKSFFLSYNCFIYELINLFGIIEQKTPPKTNNGTKTYLYGPIKVTREVGYSELLNKISNISELIILCEKYKDHVILSKDGLEYLNKLSFDNAILEPLDSRASNEDIKERCNEILAKLVESYNKTAEESKNNIKKREEKKVQIGTCKGIQIAYSIYGPVGLIYSSFSMAKAMIKSQNVNVIMLNPNVFSPDGAIIPLSDTTGKRIESLQTDLYTIAYQCISPVIGESLKNLDVSKNALKVVMALLSQIKCWSSYQNEDPNKIVSVIPGSIYYYNNDTPLNALIGINHVMVNANTIKITFNFTTIQIEEIGKAGESRKIKETIVKDVYDMIIIFPDIFGYSINDVPFPIRVIYYRKNNEEVDLTPLDYKNINFDSKDAFCVLHVFLIQTFLTNYLDQNLIKAFKDSQIYSTFFKKLKTAYDERLVAINENLDIPESWTYKKFSNLLNKCVKNTNVQDVNLSFLCITTSGKNFHIGSLFVKNRGNMKYVKYHEFETTTALKRFQYSPNDIAILRDAEGFIDQLYTDNKKVSIVNSSALKKTANGVIPVDKSKWDQITSGHKITMKLRTIKSGLDYFISEPQVKKEISTFESMISKQRFKETGEKENRKKIQDLKRSFIHYLYTADPYWKHFVTYCNLKAYREPERRKDLIVSLYALRDLIHLGHLRIPGLTLNSKGDVVIDIGKFTTKAFDEMIDFLIPAIDKDVFNRFKDQENRTIGKEIGIAQRTEFLNEALEVNNISSKADLVNQQNAIINNVPDIQNIRYTKDSKLTGDEKEEVFLYNKSIADTQLAFAMEQASRTALINLIPDMNTEDKNQLMVMEKNEFIQSLEAKSYNMPRDKKTVLNKLLDIYKKQSGVKYVAAVPKIDLPYKRERATEKNIKVDKDVIKKLQMEGNKYWGHPAQEKFNATIKPNLDSAFIKDNNAMKTYRDEQKDKLINFLNGQNAEFFNTNKKILLSGDDDERRSSKLNDLIKYGDSETIRKITKKKLKEFKDGGA